MLIYWLRLCQERQIRILMIDEMEIPVVIQIVNRIMFHNLTNKVNLCSSLCAFLIFCLVLKTCMTIQFQMLGSDWTMIGAFDLPQEVCLARF